MQVITEYFREHSIGDIGGPKANYVPRRGYPGTLAPGENFKETTPVEDLPKRVSVYVMCLSAFDNSALCTIKFSNPYWDDDKYTLHVMIICAVWRWLSSGAASLARYAGISRLLLVPFISLIMMTDELT